MSALKLVLADPIAFVEDGDEIIADLNKNELNCTALTDPAVLKARKAAWEKVVAANGSLHRTAASPSTRPVTPRAAKHRPATRAVAACIRTARSGCVAHAKQPDQALCRRTSTGRRLKRPFSCRWRSAVGFVEDLGQIVRKR